MGSRSPISTARAAPRCRGASRDAMTRLSLPSQRQHALGLSRPARRPTRCSLEARGAARRFPELPRRRDRLRQQHDDADLPPGAGARPRLGRGRRDRRHRARSPRERGALAGAGEGARHHARARCRFDAEDGELDWTALAAALDRPADPAAGHRRRLQRAGHDQRRGRGLRAGPRSRRARLRGRRALRAARAGGRAAIGCDFLACSPTSSTARTSACCRAAGAASRRSMSPSSRRRPMRRPSGWRPARRITRASSARRPRSTFWPGWRRGRRRDRRAALGAFRDAATHGPRPCSARLWDRPLGGSPGVTLYGPPPGAPRTPTLSFTVHGHSSEAGGAALAEPRASSCRHGDFYAATVLERLGVRRDWSGRVAPATRRKTKSTGSLPACGAYCS